MYGKNFLERGVNKKWWDGFGMEGLMVFHLLFFFVYNIFAAIKCCK